MPRSIDLSLAVTHSRLGLMQALLYAPPEYGVLYDMAREMASIARVQTRRAEMACSIQTGRNV